MDPNLLHQFSSVCGELCNQLLLQNYNKLRVNQLVDDLNSKPYKGELFVRKHDACSLLTVLSLNINPVDESLAAKASHLINNIITRQNIKFDVDILRKVISFHIECLKKCSDVILPDILHNLQCILQYNSQAGQKFTTDLIGRQGILINLLCNDKNSQQSLQINLLVFKCIIYLVTIDDNGIDDNDVIDKSGKEFIAKIAIDFLMKGTSKSQDQFLYCKAVIAALRILSQLYFNYQLIEIPLPELVGICCHYIMYGLIPQDVKPQIIKPSQQTVAPVPVNQPGKGGKKQRIRKQRNNAIESLKKEIPVSDRSLMKDVGSFENNSAYTPVSRNYLEPHKAKTCWALTSDSDVSDVENGRDAKLIALKSRVRQGAANLMLVLIKVVEKKDFFGYWWALLPDSPDVNSWSSEEAAKKTLAYGAVIDPIASSRASILSVILALLSGSRMYLAQAESSKENSSFTPFSVSLGYMITCMHKILVGLLDSERSHAVIIVVLKCFAALVQATPYRKLKEGLITELVRATRKYLVHRDVTLQVGALITIGCVLSIDPKTDEILRSIEKESLPSTTVDIVKNNNENISKSICDDDDFEECYSDDEMFCTNEEKQNSCDDSDTYFKFWILDICFRNLGWVFKGSEVVKCKPSAIPVILESLQVLSAITFHHLPSVLLSHVTLLSDVVCECLQHEHQDVVLQCARTVSVVGDALHKLEQSDSAPPLNQCVYIWSKLLIPLSSVLQSHENSPARAVVCDCVANVGERTFKELPRKTQMLCCALLVGSCSDEESTVRAAAVRALAMTVMYASLREDVCFVSDCGENILRVLSEPTLVVRAKAAWALGNLSDALVLNMDDPEIDDIDDSLLQRLLQASVHCANDNDKVKMSATRGLGNLLRLINNQHLLRNNQIKALCEVAIEKLLDCAWRVTNMKVRWNACYAIGNAMKNEELFTCFNGWQHQVFSRLSSLSRDCKNLKVRINAAVALRAPIKRTLYGNHFVMVWTGVFSAMENAANVDDFTEYKHKDNLIEQLCVTLSHLCCLLTPQDLSDILDPLVFHFDCAKSLFTQLGHKLPPENVSCLKILQAAKYVTVDLIANSESEMQSLGMLQELFIWDM